MEGEIFLVQLLQPCLLRRVSVIAHHRTSKMVLSVIFSTPKSSEIIYSTKDTKCTPTAHLNILRSAFCSIAGFFKNKACIVSSYLNSMY